jgi:hypothetical protein
MEAQLIIFDTNVLNLLPQDGPRADIIRKLRGSGHHRVAVPWMVLEEMAAHKAKLYLLKHRSAVEVLGKLRRELPWELQSSLEPLDLKRYLDHWRGVYSEIFEVIETSGDVALKALALPPAKRADDHSEGARDVAIWFSILEFLRSDPEQHVYFVTDNTTDFGDGTRYPYPMDEDLEGMEDRLTRLGNFDEVIAKFTKEVSGRDAKDAADRLLRSIVIRSQVSQTAVELLSSVTGFLGLGGADSKVRWEGWVAAPEAELLNVIDVTGHEIEGEVWYTAKAQWLLYGAVDAGSNNADAEYIACVWQTKILFSADEDDQTPTLLTQDPPSLPDTDDKRCMEVLQKLKETTAEAAQRALHLLTTRSSGAAAYIAQQMAARPAATIAQITSADSASSLMQQLGATNLKLGGAASLIGSLPKSTLDITGLGIGKTATEQLFGSMPKSTLDIASIGIGKTLGEQFLTSMATKLDIASFMPNVGLAKSLTASWPKPIVGIGKIGADQLFASLAKNKLAGYSFPPKTGQPESRVEPEPGDSAEEEEQPEDQD